MPPDGSSSATNDAFAKSPFFRPSISPATTMIQTPGGSKRQKPKATKEHKSSVGDASANLVNAIVGAGIVGIPFAVQEAGFVPGVCLVVICGTLCEKSLRLLIETAKHANAGSYETVAEAAFGRMGFVFVAANMFVMAYGAMLSYLMIVKDTFSAILGVDPLDAATKRAVLVVVSALVQLPLSCQRDMADLAKTSKMNVLFDTTMILLVVVLAIRERGYYDFGIGFDANDETVESMATTTTTTDTTTIDPWAIRWDTVFVGLGVLSFAFVCQHSSFIIAGSLENPTKDRWASVTRRGVGLAASLALLMGVAGYLGFSGPLGDGIDGNVLNSLPAHLAASKLAKGLLGITMLFVYPMESFVARHACVVLLFEGRRAHEGDDASVLSRRDRRIGLTVALYLSAVIPAALCEQLGDVLAVSGAIGGSCLSYIGPGIVFIGIHGGRFLELSREFFGTDLVAAAADGNDDALLGKDTATTPCSGLAALLKGVLWYGLGMPAWTRLASIGKGGLTSYATELALNSPHPIRIGNVRFARAAANSNQILITPTRKKKKFSLAAVSSSDNNYSGNDNNDDTADDEEEAFHPRGRLIRADSLPKSYRTIPNNNNAGSSGNIVAGRSFLPPKASAAAGGYRSIRPSPIKSIGDDDMAIEDDPQAEPPTVLDFVIAISYVVFGIIAMVVGLGSIFL